MLRFLRHRIKYFFNNNIFVLIWILNITIFDILSIELYLSNCRYQGLSQNSNQDVHAVVIADPQLTDAYSYKQQPGLLLSLTEFFSDIYMIRNFRRIQYFLNPDAVIFVGDLMDGGREWNNSQYLLELKRFERVFRMTANQKIIYLAGNHDIGFGDTIIDSAHDRFVNTFGKLNSVTNIANHSIIRIDTLGISGLATSQAHKNAFEFLEQDFDKLAPVGRRILLSHVPFWRPENSDCGPRRRSHPIRNMRGYQYQNLIQYPIVSSILRLVKPSLIISGDDHDDCVYNHDMHDRIHVEHTIGTFSWLQGNLYPSFGVMTFRPSNSIPKNADSPSFQLNICSLPPQLNFYRWYIILFAISVVGTWIKAKTDWQHNYQRVGGNQTQVKFFFGKIWELGYVVGVVEFLSLMTFRSNRSKVEIPPLVRNKPPVSYSHWKNSKHIDIGINVIHRQSDKSMINYTPASVHTSASAPSYTSIKSSQKNQQLPKISNFASSDLNTWHLRPDDIITLPSIPVETKYFYKPKQDLISAYDHGLNENDQLDWLSLQQSTLLKLMLDHAERNSTFLNILPGLASSNLETAKSPQRQVLIDVLYQSSTIAHIHTASQLYNDHFNLKLPSISEQEFEFILEYLLRTWLSKIKVDTIFLQPFEVPIDLLLGVMENAHYLDLNGLIDFCASAIAKNFDKVDSFGGLSDYLIGLILRHLHIGELVVAEYKLFGPDCQIDFSAFWLEKYSKVMSSSNVWSFDQANIGSDNVCKQKSIEFYVSQVLQKLARGSSCDLDLFQKVISIQGFIIKELIIYIDHSSSNLDFEFWNFLFKRCKNSEVISIKCRHANEGLAKIISATATYTFDVNISFATNMSCNNTIFPEVLQYGTLPPMQIQNQQPKCQVSGALNIKTEKEFNLTGNYSEQMSTKKNLSCIQQTKKAISVSFYPEHETSRYQSTLLPLSCLQTPYVFPFINALSMRGIQLSPENVLHLVDYISSVGSSFSLTNLDISRTAINCKHLANILAAIVSSEPVLSKLTSLSLANIVIHDDEKSSEASKQLCQAISSIKKLSYLDISGNMFPILNTRQICESLMKSKIKSINLAGLNLSTAFDYLIRWCYDRAIGEFSLSDCHILPRSLSSIVEAISNSIKIFDLSYNIIDLSVLNSIFSSATIGSLVSLNLSGCLKGINDISFLTRAKVLKIIKLRSCGINDRVALQISEFWSCSKLQQIRQWDLSKNHITEDGAYQMKNGMVMAKSGFGLKRITAMDLSENSISDECIKELDARIHQYGFEGLMLILRNKIKK